jgi:hypothetical protein
MFLKHLRLKIQLLLTKKTQLTTRSHGSLTPMFGALVAQNPESKH